MDLNTSKISTRLILASRNYKKGYCYINLNVKYEEHVHSKPPHKLAFKIKLLWILWGAGQLTLTYNLKLQLCL